MTLDHLIAAVPDLRATHRRLVEAGFEEAWPPGPFWPSAITSGVALGGANLELIQPDAGVDAPWIETLVLAPETLEEGRTLLPEAPATEKVEPDPALLALRGFPPAMAASPQAICTNLYPEEPAYPFFLCLYAPFLKARLAPANFASPHGPLTGLVLQSPEPETARRLFAGRLGPIELDVEGDERAGVRTIRFADGSALTAADL